MSSEERLNEVARELRNAYYRDWRRKNPEKVSAANRKYWEKKAGLSSGGKSSGDETGGKDAENQSAETL